MILTQSGYVKGSWMCVEWSIGRQGEGKGLSAGCAVDVLLVGVDIDLGESESGYEEERAGGWVVLMVRVHKLSKRSVLVVFPYMEHERC